MHELSLHCKNKWVEITHAWLPELHTSKDNCNSGNQAWVTSTHLFLQCNINAVTTQDASQLPCRIEIMPWF